MKKIVCIVSLLFSVTVLCACGRSVKSDPIQQKATIPPTVSEISPSTESTSANSASAPTQEVAETTPTATLAPAVAITKDPYDETVLEGSNAWFIAHADNADSISWLFTAPDGTVTDSVDVLTGQLPGLEAEVLPEDTIALRKIPLAMNGWKVQARFDGAGGTAVTQTATIYVNSYLNAYEAVLEIYRVFKDIPQEEYTAYGGENTPYDVNGVSLMTRFNTDIGYSLQDMNGDGIPELLLGLMESDDEFYDNVIYDMFTLIDGTPHRVFISWERCRYYLTSLGYIYNTSSSGASWSDYNLCTFDGNNLKVKEAVWSTNRIDHTFGAFYSDQGGSDQENFVAITDEEFANKIQEYEAMIIPFDPANSIYK